jgi:TetR/AcrR family transcriptional regulator, transcriptional repressor for nem operon
MPKPNYKETLIEAGLAAFHRGGYHATGVQEIVTSAGIPKGSFYAHFESKDALGLAALARYSADRAAARALLRDVSLPGLARLDRYLAALGYCEDGCLVGNFTAELAHLDAFREDLAHLWRRWTDALAECLADGQRDGSVRADVPVTELARTVLALWEGAVLSAKLERGPQPLEIVRRTLQRLLAP